MYKDSSRAERVHADTQLRFSAAAIIDVSFVSVHEVNAWHLPYVTLMLVRRLRRRPSTKWTWSNCILYVSAGMPALHKDVVIL